MLKRRHYIALSLVLLITLVLLNLPGKTAGRMKLAAGSLFVPLFGLANSSKQITSSTLDAAVPRSELLRQNEALRRENQELKLQVTRAEETFRENQRLRHFFGWQRQKPWKLKLANVVLRDPANWWQTVQIDLGTRDGASNNLPVLDPDGALVGRIASAGFTRSQVVLLGDPNCKVAARVENPARDTGVIGPSGPVDGETVELGYLSRNASLKAGQDVKTSGLGGIYPKDILIGKVIDSRQVEYGLYTVARVRLAANLNALEEVWVWMEP